MNAITKMLILGVLCMQLGCASTSTSNQGQENRFSFTYNDQEYSILHRSLPLNNTVNYLLSREGEAIVLSARDNNLDGVLDTLLIGDLPLETANTVYAFGINQSIAEGRYEQGEESRVFLQRTSEGFYAVQSYQQSAGVWYNTFVVYDTAEQQETRFVDQRADGVLNQVETGVGDLAATQALYQSFLEKGIQAGYIANKNGFYIVKLP